MSCICPNPGFHFDPPFEEGFDHLLVGIDHALFHEMLVYHLFYESWSTSLLLEASHLVEIDLSSLIRHSSLKNS